MELGTAVPGDLPQLVELLGILFTQEHELSSDALKQRCALELILADPSRARTYVARDGGKVIAMAALHFTISTAEGGKVAGLEDCVVHPEHRRKGIGEKLLRYVPSPATAYGALRVRLITEGYNPRALALYPTLGYTRWSWRAFCITLLGGPSPHPTRSNPAHASGRLA
jgi:GNAT superfamily N-acetyltransferase